MKKLFLFIAEIAYNHRHELIGYGFALLSLAIGYVIWFGWRF